MDRILERFGISNVKLFGNPDTKVRKVGVLGGSGKSEIDLAVAAGCDVYISGDIDHHSGIDALEKGIAVIDAGHYGLEHVFSEYMREYLESKFKDIEISLEIKHEPYLVYK
jgi:putative NIF3 family GTP cyclohydrolase 1 type 2